MIEGRPIRRLLILASDLAPSPSVGRLRVQKFCKYLPQFLWQARVVTFEVGYGADRRLLAELPEDLQVDRVPVPNMIDGLAALAKTLLRRTRGKSWQRPKAAPSDPQPAPEAMPGGAIDRISRRIDGFKKFLDRRVMIPDPNMLAIGRMVRAAVRVVRQWRPDAMLVSVPGFSPFVAAALVQRMTGVPLVVDYRDLWHGDVLREWVGPIRSGVELAIERRCLRQCSAVIAVSRNYLAEALAVAGTRARLASMSLTNGFDRDDFHAAAPPPPRNGRPLTVLHAGRLFKSRTADALLEALGRLKAAGRAGAADIRLTFLGDVEAAQMRRLEAIIAAHSLAAMVEFRPYVTRSQCLAMEAAADCLLVIGNEGTRSAGTMSMKLFEYAGAARPVLALLNEGEGRQFVLSSGIGRTAPISDAAAIAETLTGLLDDWRQGRPLASPNTVFLADYDFRNIVGRLAAFLDPLTGHRS